VEQNVYTSPTPEGGRESSPNATDGCSPEDFPKTERRCWRSHMEKPPQLGHGILEVSWVEGRSAITRAQAVNPLKLLTPRRRGAAAWVYTSTFGGGLVAGDEIDLEVRIGPQATCVINTQSFTKVYKNPAKLRCGQRLRATVSNDALLVLAPDPVTCFAGATYNQQQRFDVHPDGALVVVDWLTSGRRARDECWAFSKYCSHLDVYVGQEHVLADRLLLDSVDGPLEAPYRMGRFHCLAVVVLVGERLGEERQRLLEQVSGQPVKRESQIIEAASPIRHGAVFRIMGMATEQVAQHLREKLRLLDKFLGDTPWARKW